MKACIPKSLQRRSCRIDVVHNGFGFLFTALVHLLNINKYIYISGQKWKNEGLQYFKKENQNQIW